jgi:ribosomal protein S4E
MPVKERNYPVGFKDVYEFHPLGYRYRGRMDRVVPEERQHIIQKTVRNV